MEEYGVSGKVAWVYRQFPLADLHPNSTQIAESALCVGKLGGSKAFWEFTNLVYNSRQATDFTNVTKIPEFIEESEVSLSEHESCLKDGSMKERLAYEMEDAIDAGVTGTPYTFISVAGQTSIINGMESYQTMKGIISNLVDQLDGEYNIDTATTTDKVPTNNSGIPIIE
jgi:protein-disulfide isomerase